MLKLSETLRRARDVLEMIYASSRHSCYSITRASSGIPLDFLGTAASFPVCEL